MLDKKSDIEKIKSIEVEKNGKREFLLHTQKENLIDKVVLTDGGTKLLIKIK